MPSSTENRYLQIFWCIDRFISLTHCILVLLAHMCVAILLPASNRLKLVVILILSRDRWPSNSVFLGNTRRISYGLGLVHCKSMEIREYQISSEIIWTKLLFVFQAEVGGYAPLSIHDETHEIETPTSTGLLISNGGHTLGPMNREWLRWFVAAYAWNRFGIVDVWGRHPIRLRHSYLRKKQLWFFFFRAC